MTKEEKEIEKLKKEVEKLKSEKKAIAKTKKKATRVKSDSTSSDRLLDIYIRASQGEILKKSELAKEFNRNERSVLRSFQDLNSYFLSKRLDSKIAYDSILKGHVISKDESQWLTKGEVLSTIKVLFGSRGFSKKNLENIIGKLLKQTSKEDQKLIEGLIKSEMLHYEPIICNAGVDNDEEDLEDTNTDQEYIEKVWEFSKFIERKSIIRIKYRKPLHNVDNSSIIKTRQLEELNKKTVKQYYVQPLAVMFSEFYFYLLAYTIPNEDFKKFKNNEINVFPKKEFRTFRVDRIKSISDTGKFDKDVSYVANFSEGEFRKRISFMYAGDAYRIVFDYEGALEPIFDRFPTSKVTKDYGNLKYQITAEVIGKGYEMWISSYGDKITNLTERKMVT